MALQSQSRVHRSLPPPEVVIDSIEYLAREQPTKRAEQTCSLTYYRLLDAFGVAVGSTVISEYVGRISRSVAVRLFRPLESRRLSRARNSPATGSRKTCETKGSRTDLLEFLYVAIQFRENLVAGGSDPETSGIRSSAWTKGYTRELATSCILLLRF